jgi:hypothetical protein
MKYYNESERKYFRNNLYEVVLIGSKDLDTIKNTHGHYFPEELLKTGDSYNKKIAALSKY